MKTTLVTGATGLVGYNIVQSLLQRDRKVRLLVRSVEKAEKFFNNKCEITQGDITDLESIRKTMEGCQIVYHAAGFPEQWMKNPSIFHEVNVQGTQNMIKVALEQKIEKFIYTSTIDVFKAEKGKRFDESELDPNPKGTYYERSKQQADQYVNLAIDNGLNAIFLHPAGVYGPGPTDSPGTNGFITDLSQNKIPVLLPGGYPVVFAPDVGEAHFLAEEKGSTGDRFILSESYFDLTNLVIKILKELNITKKPPVVVPLPLVMAISTIGEWWSGISNKPPLIPKGQLHFLQWQAKPISKKAIDKLGWKPTPFQEGLRQTIQYLNLI
jgi:dihydroflavonol-4-reductase